MQCTQPQLSHKSSLVCVISIISIIIIIIIIKKIIIMIIKNKYVYLTHQC